MNRPDPFNWYSTKLLHAMAVQTVASLALFTGHLDGPEWVAASTLALGIYSIADVTQKRIQRRSNNTPRRWPDEAGEEKRDERTD